MNVKNVNSASKNLHLSHSFTLAIKNFILVPNTVLRLLNVG